MRNPVKMLRYAYRITMQSCFQFHNDAEVYIVLLNCFAIPTLKTLLAQSLSFYIAEHS